MTFGHFGPRTIQTAWRFLSIAILLVCGHGALAADLIDETTARLAASFSAGSRYVIGNETADNPHPFCRELTAKDDLLKHELLKPYAGLAGHQAARILECDYKFPASQRRGWVIVVAATPRNLAERMVNACNEVAPRDSRRCVEKLIDNRDYDAPAGSNSFIFPITGFIRETCAGGENLIGFRHGVTIQYTDSPTSRLKLDYCVTKHETVNWQREAGLTYGTFDVFDVARPAALSRVDLAYDRIIPPPDEGTIDGLTPDDFQIRVIENELRAVTTGHDRMMVIKAALKTGVAVPAQPNGGMQTATRVNKTAYVPIPPFIWKYMKGRSWHAELPCPARTDLMLLTVPYNGFDGRRKIGQLVVSKDHASSIASAMDEILDAGRFRINRMELVDRFKGDDDASMAANNTSAFNCRLVSGTDRLSAHALGIAIDINPIQNPYVTSSRTFPPGGKAFDEASERTPSVIGIILAGGEATEAFAKIGWEWGGTWTSKKDYQHFSENGN